MIIGNEVSLNDVELMDRKNRGVKFIELKLSLDDLKDIQLTLNKKPTLKQLGLTVYAVKPPTLNSYGSECVLGEANGLKRKENINLIKKSILIAEKLSNTATPLVVVSIGGLLSKSDLTPKRIKTKKELVEQDIFELRQYISENYPNVMLLFENNEIVKTINDEEYMYAYGIDEDLLKWVRSFRDKHIGICLNVEHAMKVLHFNKQNNIDSLCSSLPEYIDVYAPALKLIRLSNIEEVNANHLNGGLPFNSDVQKDQEFLKAIFKKIGAIKYISPITINTIEQNTDSAVNFSKTRNSIIQSLMKR